MNTDSDPCWSAFTPHLRTPQVGAGVRVPYFGCGGGRALLYWHNGGKKTSTLFREGLLEALVDLFFETRLETTELLDVGPAFGRQLCAAAARAAGLRLHQLHTETVFHLVNLIP